MSSLPFNPPNTLSLFPKDTLSPGFPKSPNKQTNKQITIFPWKAFFPCLEGFLPLFGRLSSLVWKAFFHFCLPCLEGFLFSLFGFLLLPEVNPGVLVSLFGFLLLPEVSPPGSPRPAFKRETCV
jgi:hypothetical protein